MKKPINFAATHLTGMHVKAYQNFLEYLGKPRPSYEVMFQRDQSALMHDDIYCQGIQCERS